MTPAPVPGKNRVICLPGEAYLEVLDTGEFLMSCWEPNDEEIERLKNGEKVWVAIGTRQHPPIGVGVGQRSPWH